VNPRKLFIDLGIKNRRFVERQVVARQRDERIVDGYAQRILRLLGEGRRGADERRGGYEGRLEQTHYSTP